MPEPKSPQQQTSTPPIDQLAPTPRSFQPQTPLDQFIATTLSEIQQEQGRGAERYSNLNQKIDQLSGKIEALTISSALSASTLSRIEPEVSKHNSLYNKVLGSWIGISALIVIVGGLLYWTNAARMEKLIRVLDSPAVTKLMSKEK